MPSPQAPPAVPPASSPAADAQAAHLARSLLPLLAATGFALAPATAAPGQLVHAPCALLPRPFPRTAFHAAQALARGFNALVDGVAARRGWLEATLAASVAGDAFTGRLLGVLRAVEAEAGPRQRLVLGVHRSDYMVDRGPAGDAPPRLAQIELNTVSAGFAALAAGVAGAHAALLQRHAGSLPLVAGHLGLPLGAPPSVAVVEAEVAARCPPNPSLRVVAGAMAAAHAAYGARHGGGGNGGAAPCVLFVVQPVERNIMDQRLLERALWQGDGDGAAPGVRVRRMTLAEVARWGRLREGDGALVLPSEAAMLLGPGHADSGGQAGGPPRASPWAGGGDDDADVVSLVYFRAGYTPRDYPTEAGA